MTYKSILVHLNNAHRAERLLDVAVRLAVPMGAHVTGLYVVPHVPITSPVFPGLAGSVVASGLEAYRKVGETVHAQFERATAGQPIVAEWRPVEAGARGYHAAVLDRARAADIVLASQHETEWDYGDMFDIPDQLAMESGRPVLMVPRVGDVGTIGRRVLVAWNDSRESARATFDALPLLKAADEVRVLVVAERDKPEATRQIAGAEIAATLARHGVACIADHLNPTDRADPGRTLLAHAAAHRCDLLVMGCYGRSRFRQLILGGVTRHVLATAALPVLMAH
jgi:nucleotide-binding universal stress UspA family protein